MSDRQRPSGAEDMLEPGAWPDASETQFHRVAQDCLDALRNLVNNGMHPWDTNLRDTFRNGGGNWSGSAAGAADGKGGKILTNFAAMQNHLTVAANWNNDLSHTIAGAKDSIINNVNNAKADIEKISTDAPNYETLVRNRKTQCYNDNLSVVKTAAQAAVPPESYKPRATDQQLLANGLPEAPGAAPIAPTTTAPPPAPKAGEGPKLEGTEAQNQPSPPAPNNKPTPDEPAGPKAGLGPKTPVVAEQDHPAPGSPGGAATPVSTPATKGGDGPKIAAPRQQDPAPAPGLPAVNDPTSNGSTPGGSMVTSPLQPGPRPANSTSAGGSTTTTTSPAGSASSGGLGGTTGGSGTPQSGSPTGQPTAAQQPGSQPNNPLQQGLQQFGQGLQSGAGNTSQPLAAAQPATQQPTTPPPPATPTGAAGGTSGTSAAPVGAASAAGGGGSVGGPAAATPAAPAAPLGPAPTPSPAAPVAQPGQGGPVGPTGPGVAAAGTNNQQAAAAAAPIPVSPARAERDAMAAAAKAGLLQRKSAGNTDADIEIARRISAALHAPPSIPAASYQFVWAVGVTSEGQILAANSYGIGYIPDGVKLPGQVTLVSADEAISPAERGRWVNVPFLALQGWAQFHGKTLRAIIGTPDEVKPYKSSMHAEELAPDDIPADGTMQGRSRLQVIAPEAAARLEEWSDVTLYEALPPRPVQDAPPDAKQTMKLWVETIKPLLRTTGTNGPVDHLTKLIAYADHMQSVELYKAYTAPHVAAQRAAMSDWIYWQHVSSICQDATNPVLGSVQA